MIRSVPGRMHLRSPALGSIARPGPGAALVVRGGPYGDYRRGPRIAPSRRYPRTARRSGGHRPGAGPGAASRRGRGRAGRPPADPLLPGGMDARGPVWGAPCGVPASDPGTDPPSCPGPTRSVGCAVSPYIAVVGASWARRPFSSVSIYRILDPRTPPRPGTWDGACRLRGSLPGRMDLRRTVRRSACGPGLGRSGAEAEPAATWQGRKIDLVREPSLLGRAISALPCEAQVRPEARGGAGATGRSRKTMPLARAGMSGGIGEDPPHRRASPERRSPPGPGNWRRIRRSTYSGRRAAAHTMSITSTSSADRPPGRFVNNQLSPPPSRDPRGHQSLFIQGPVRR